MGSLTLAYPSIAGKTTQEQLESMRRYLCGMAEQLNLADWSARAALTEIAQAIDADGKEDDAFRLCGFKVPHHQDGGFCGGEFGGLVGEACGELCRGVGLRDVSGKDAADDRGQFRRDQTAV